MPAKACLSWWKVALDAARQGVAVRLTLVGAESPEFSAHLDGYAAPPGLRIARRGTLEYDEVQALLAAHDIFCFPTRHLGEGHPNVITEAMAHGIGDRDDAARLHRRTAG